jgi:hypothetical protein
METEITCSAINCTAGTALQNKTGVNYTTILYLMKYLNTKNIWKGPQTIRQGF